MKFVEGTINFDLEAQLVLLLAACVRPTPELNVPHGLDVLPTAT